jgi:two-component system sensor kinase ParS
MVRLFLKFYGVLIATLVVSFMVQMQVIDYVWSHVGEGFDFRVRFAPTFRLLEDALAPSPVSEWRARFERITADFGIASRMGDAQDMPELARMNAQQAQRYAAREIVILERPEGGFTLMKHLRGSELAAAFDMPGPDRTRGKLVTYAVNWSVEFTLVAALVLFWVRPFWRELLSLRRAAEQVGEGDFSARALTGRHSALRDVAEAFNRMAGQVAQLLQSHRTLTSAVSHELRTPIARLRFGHSLAREETTATGKDRFLARMEGDIAEIDQLTSELLDYARLERGAPALALQNVPADAWLEDVLEGARAEVLPGAQDLEVCAAVEVETLRCEPRYMGRAVANLVRNARVHARKRVRVTVATTGEAAALHVDDDGPGIAPGDRDRVFEPFVRADGSRDRDSGGFGLGLAIVRQVARWHGGDADIGDSPLGGARVSIRWPLAAAATHSTTLTTHPATGEP